MNKLKKSTKQAELPKELRPVLVEALMKRHGFNPSLPSIVLGVNGFVIGMNRRMKSLLGETIALPVAASDFEKYWLFHNEDDAGPALWKKSLTFHDEQVPLVVVAEAKLKTFRLTTRLCEASARMQKKRALKKGQRRRLSDGLGADRLIVAEIVRSGDLLRDRASRQTLFRSISHEIRTSVMAMNGYTQMILATPEDRSSVKNSAERLQFLLRRLESVVARLNEFKSEMDQ
jgi:signal transduction histidine kinase